MLSLTGIRDRCDNEAKHLDISLFLFFSDDKYSEDMS